MRKDTNGAGGEGFYRIPLMELAKAWAPEEKEEPLVEKWQRLREELKETKEGVRVLREKVDALASLLAKARREFLETQRRETDLEAELVEVRQALLKALEEEEEEE